jgi:hypothetical protein
MDWVIIDVVEDIKDRVRGVVHIILVETNLHLVLLIDHEVADV